MLLLDQPRNSCFWKGATPSNFRKASSKIFRTYGTNLQNPPEALLRIHIADTGKKLIQLDQAGADARILAYLLPDGNYRDLFKNNIRVHSWFAMHIFADHWRQKFGNFVDLALRLKPGELKQQIQWPDLQKYIKSDFVRDFLGKKSGHSFNYGEMPKKFREEVLKGTDGKVVLSKIEAERIHYVYHSIVPEISQVYWVEIEKQIRSTRTLVNLFGYPRTFYGHITHDLIRNAYSWIPSSTVAIINNTAQYEIQQEIENNPSFQDVDILNNKHDSILVQCDIGHEQEVISMCRNYLEKTLTNLKGESFKMLSGVSVGNNWGKFDQEKNPQGMREI